MRNAIFKDFNKKNCYGYEIIHARKERTNGKN